MSYSNYPQGFPQGITVRGLPIQQGYPGHVWWVNNSTVPADGGIVGNDGNPGTYQKPFSTLEKADTVAVTNRGDIIMLMPGHAESLASAAAINFDTDGAAIVGLGNGDLKATFTFTDAAADFDIDAEGVALVNCSFLFNASSSVTNALDINGNGCTVDNCHFQPSSAGKGADSCITVASFDRATITNCTFQMLNAVTNGAAVTDLPVNGVEVVDAHNTTIENCVFMGDFTVAAIEGKSTLSRGLTIRDNLIHNVATEDIASAIDLIDACTGIISNNLIHTANSTSGAPTMIDAASCSNLMNFGNEAVGEATWPILIGAAAST